MKRKRKRGITMLKTRMEGGTYLFSFEGSYLGEGSGSSSFRSILAAGS